MPPVHLRDGNAFEVDLEPRELTPDEEALAAEFYGWENLVHGRRLATASAILAAACINRTVRPNL